MRVHVIVVVVLIRVILFNLEDLDLSIAYTYHIQVIGCVGGIILTFSDITFKVVFKERNKKTIKC